MANRNHGLSEKEMELVKLLMYPPTNPPTRHRIKNMVK